LEGAQVEGYPQLQRISTDHDLGGTDRGVAGRFLARLDDGPGGGHLIATPFFAAARALLAAGVHPDCMLMMKHSTAVSNSLRATISTAARLTVE